jgi:hypothetical protein
MKNGLLDWDCPEAIDIPGMADSLAYIRQHASFPVSLLFFNYEGPEPTFSQSQPSNPKRIRILWASAPSQSPQSPPSEPKSKQHSAQTIPSIQTSDYVS